MTRLQAAAPGDLQGRLMGLMWLASFSLSPVSLALAGVLAEQAPAVLFLGGAGLVLLATLGAFAVLPRTGVNATPEAESIFTSIPR